ALVVARPRLHPSPYLNGIPCGDPVWGTGNQDPGRMPCGRYKSDRSNGLEEFQVTCDFTSLPAAVHVQFAVDTLHLRFHRIDRDDQFLGDLRVGATGSKQAEHALLLGTERLDEQSRGSRR